VKNGKIVISWQAPADNGGDAIISYKIYRGISSSNETYFLTLGNISSFTDTNLVNGQTYYYRITAVNAMGESPWSGEVIAMVYISENGNQTFTLIVILLFGAVIGVSGYIIHFSRKMKRLEGMIAKKSIGLPSKKAFKPLKIFSADLFEVEDQIKQLPIQEEEKELISSELHGIENEERIEVLNAVNPNLSESEAKTLWDSLMQRFNRLYKLENWAQALILLESLFELAEFLGDDSKFTDLSSKYDEIQEKYQKNFFENHSK